MNQDKIRRLGDMLEGALIAIEEMKKEEEDKDNTKGE